MPRTRSRTATLAPYQVVALDITRLTLEAVKPYGLGNRDALRCKAMWALGLALVDVRSRPRAAGRVAPGEVRRQERQLVDANVAALNAGHAYGETAELGAPLKQFRVAPAEMRARPLSHRDRRRDASRSAWWPAASSPVCRCSSAPIRSRRRARSCTTWRG